MTTQEYESIKSKIKTAENNKIKAEGVIETIKAQWKSEFGTDNYDEIVKIAEDMKSNIDDDNKKLTDMMSELEKSYDWSTLPI